MLTALCGTILASGTGRGEIYAPIRHHALLAPRLHQHSPSSHLLADDFLSHFFVGTQILEILPLSASLLTHTGGVMPGVEKDLLSLIQRRRV